MARRKRKLGIVGAALLEAGVAPPVPEKKAAPSLCIWHRNPKPCEQCESIWRFSFAQMYRQRRDEQKAAHEAYLARRADC